MARSYTDALVGSEIINITPNTASVSQFQPSIAALSGGGYVVVYTNSSQAGDASGNAISGQIVAANGALSGGPFLVNTSTNMNQFAPQVVALSNGNFVVVWEDEAGIGMVTEGASKSDVFGRVFTATGSPVAGQFLLNQNAFWNQSQPSVAATANGGFIAVWTSEHLLYGQVGNNDAFGIYGRRFDSTGTTYNDFQVMQNLSFATLNERNPWITVLAAGKFVVVSEAQSAAYPGGGWIPTGTDQHRGGGV